MLGATSAASGATAERKRRPITQRVMRARDPDPSAPLPPEGIDDPEMIATRRDDVRRIREARERLRTAAGTGRDADVEHGLVAFVASARGVGFMRVTTCSIAAAALEEGLPRRRGSSARGRAAVWVRRARELYDALELGYS